MFNFDNRTVPLFFPVLEGVQLQPWFSSSLLDSGLNLIRDRTIDGFHCIRNTTGALIDGKAIVTLQFTKSTRLQQGFIIRHSHCGLCGSEAKDKACEHLAALAILSLITPPAEGQAIPIPLGFVKSTWHLLGHFLYDWLKKSKYSLERTTAKDYDRWQITADDGSIEVNLPASALPLGQRLFPDKSRPRQDLDKNDALALLIAQMQVLTMTMDERRLQKAGSGSSGWKKETSFWLWLTRMLYTFHRDDFPTLQADPAACRFSLQVGDAHSPGALTLDLSASKTWDLVRTIDFPPEQIRILPAADECYRLFFNDDNLLEVRPCLTLPDGRVLDRQELAANRFFGVYYLPGEGFLPTRRLPQEGTFANPTRQEAAMPLLGYLDNEQIRDLPFTVAINDIPTFLAKNREALHRPDNIIAPELLELQVREFPDQLIIDTFEEHDDWCYLSCHYGLGNTTITLEDILTARQRRLTSLPGKQWLQIDDTPLSWFYELAENRLAGDGSGRIRLSRRELLALTAMMPEVSVTEKKHDVRQRLKELLDVEQWTDSLSLAQVPGHLRPYQRNGLAWLNRLFSLGIGGLLADDMGLGKTHQCLALLKAAARQNEDLVSLVVCPASVVLNWAAKIDEFYQGLDYALYYGPQRELAKTLEHGIVLTTYGVLRQDLDRLRAHPFAIVLFDEIQNLKNRQTATHQAASKLDGRVKIGLTGTPVENSLQDLRSLFDICLPGLLGSERYFDRHYVQPITAGAGNAVRERLNRLIHPFILRRTREQVLTELPEIIDDNRLCELSDDQIGLYREVIRDREQDLEELADENTAVPYMNILSTITRLKRICCHPCLVQGCEDPDEYTSGKWELFIELGQELLAAEMKFVVFSQYTDMLALIERYLKRSGIGFASLKGEMTVGKRQKMIEAFQRDPDCRVFCASLLAGGVGIDLTSAQAVIHYDRWWNPAREEQATARVHRMGQKNVVQVFRLITAGTLEEKIHQLIGKKRELAKSLLQEDEAGMIKQLDRRQLAELFRLTPVGHG
ncbi:MAG: DEAD/DEAH box helicase [Desulfopila sp.]